MKTSKNINSLQSLSASQWGMFSSAQAQDICVGRTQISRMLSDGRLEKCAPGIYRFTSGEETSFAEIKAYWLAAFPKEIAFSRIQKTHPDAVVAGRTAAYMHQIGDMYATPYTFIVERRRQTRNQIISYKTWQVEDCDIEVIEGLPVTKVERTIADLIRLKEEQSLVDDVIKDAIRAKTIDSHRLAELLAPLAARNGYERDDGRSFAEALIVQNSDLHQVIVSALDPVRKLYANMDAFQEPLRNISQTLLQTSNLSANLAKVVAGFSSEATRAIASQIANIPFFSSAVDSEAIRTAVSQISNTPTFNINEVIASTLGRPLSSTASEEGDTDEV